MEMFGLSVMVANVVCGKRSVIYWSDTRKFWDNGMCKTVLNLLESRCSRFLQFVAERITVVKLEMNN